MKYVIYRAAVADVLKRMNESKIEYTKEKRGAFHVLTTDISVEKFLEVLDNYHHGKEIQYITEKEFENPSELRRQMGLNHSCFFVMQE